MEAVAQVARQRARLESMVRELRTAVRILNPEVETLRAVHNGPAPAWTDGVNVYLNYGELPTDVRKDSDIAVWVGAALHELGHTVFTPRDGCELYRRLESAKRTLTPNAFLIFNVLEDQRQERAMVARFAPVRGYFSVIAIELILSDQANAANAWPLIAGRTWIPTKARQAVRAQWVAQHGEHSASEIARIVSAFQRLTDPGNLQAVAAAALIVEFSRLLAGAPAPSCGADPMRRSGDAMEAPDSGAPTAEDMQEGDQGDQEGGDQGDQEGGDQGDQEGGDQGDQGDQEGGDQGDQEGGDQGDQEGGDQGDQGDQEGGDQGDQEGGDQEGAQGGDQAGAPGDQATRKAATRKALEDSISDALEASDVARDLERYSGAILASAGGDAPEKAQGGSYLPAEITAGALAQRERITETLGELRAAAESGIIRATDRGSLIAARAGDPYCDPDTAYNLFSPDALDSVGTSAVILVDVSGSMFADMNELSLAVWAIHHAAHSAELERFHVVAFSDSAQTIIAPGDLPTEHARRVPSGGGTSATEAVRFAHSELVHSDSAHRIFLTLSDGEWWDHAESDALIGDMRASGITTACALYGSGDQARHGHGAELFANVEDISDLATLFARLVSEAMAGALM